MKRIQFDANNPGKGVVANSYEKPPMACVADGCMWKASASFGGGPFACIGHQLAEDPRDWPAITRRTNELQWFADFIAEIQRGINMPKPGTNWAQSAKAFFDGSDYPFLAPTEKECKHPSQYVYRLLGEARALARGEARPKPMIPHAQSRDWLKQIRKPMNGDEHSVML